MSPQNGVHPLLQPDLDYLVEAELQNFSYVNGSCAIWSFLGFGAVQWIMQTISREEKEAELRFRPELVGYQKPAGMAIP
ncbi:PLAC8-domain-containing protein [Penicillium waksmanii]|uniref:PLAC8-domain-containing protein n=1 Tax=Penicillium waksmanii TaxID=69791 RepID=UPI00254718C8|nr:PLAC8-domain-containing protein [Penicillium waksmanii]KAJ5999642.1 PLAC8-domain-containing protein [Penicillium waksmanii]